MVVVTDSTFEGLSSIEDGGVVHAIVNIASITMTRVSVTNSKATNGVLANIISFDLANIQTVSPTCYLSLKEITLATLSPET